MLQLLSRSAASMIVCNECLASSSCAAHAARPVPQAVTAQSPLSVRQPVAPTEGPVSQDGGPVGAGPQGVEQGSGYNTGSAPARAAQMEGLGRLPCRAVCRGCLLSLYGCDKFWQVGHIHVAFVCMAKVNWSYGITTAVVALINQILLRMSGQMPCPDMSTNICWHVQHLQTEGSVTRALPCGCSSEAGKAE
jgi:hypothetical protein